MDAGGVYRTLAPAVRGYLRGQGVPEPDDVLSEVFLQVARSLHRFRGGDEDLRRWVFTIARNRAIDDRRRRARRPAPAAGAVPDSPAPSASEPLDPQLVAALGQLTPDQREVVLLRFVADLPLGEVARITRRSAGAVKSIQHRGLAQLGRILGGPDGAVGSDD